MYVVGTCVSATMGGKNYSNRTQWVGWVKAETYGSSAVTVKLEVWGDGFYFETNTDRNASNVTSPLWGAQRWVRSGTNVCAARTRTDGWRDIACFHVRV